MKNLPILFLIASFAAAAAAELPKPAPLFRYQPLWENSPFTTKPPPPPNEPDANPLEDYALGGISPIGGGQYRVTLLNRKNPEERIVIPDNPDYKILSVQYSQGNALGTTVRVSTGSKTGTVAFDEKLLVLKAAPAAPQPQQNAQNAPPGTVPQPPVPGQQQGDAPRQPRPRVVPPTTNGAPQPQPQVAPQGQQQQQNQRIQGQQRQNRR